jgi:acetyltransferase-like isoleucine patch superfamily enzyme
VRRVYRRCDELRLAWNILRGRAVARLWAARGARIGSRTAIGRRCLVDRPWCVELGERVLLEADVYFKMVADTASLKVSDYVFFGRGVEIDVLGNVSVGAHTIIAPRCFITDHNHGVLPGLRIDQQPCPVEPVAIGSDVWLGAGVVVLPGVAIGDGAVVGANSVVTKDVAAMAVVVGAPARVLRMRSDDRRDEGQH